MGLLNPSRDIRRGGGYKSQSFTGFVVNNDDSQHEDKQKRQRVQFRQSQNHRGIEDGDLPYAMPMPNANQANAGAGVGAVNIPPKGAKVMIHYDSEDPHIAYYSSSPTTDDVNKDNELLKQDYPNTAGEVDSAGNVESKNLKKNTKNYTHKSGAAMQVGEKGQMYFYSPEQVSIGSGGDVIIAAKGSIYSHAGGNNSIKGSRIDLNGSDATKQPTAVGARQTPNIPDPSGKMEA